MHLYELLLAWYWKYVCQDHNCKIPLCLYEVILSLIHFSAYKCLSDIDLDTQDRIEMLLTQTSSVRAGWRHIAFRYGMDQVKIKSLENDSEAGKRTLEYLRSCNPNLTVYDFCKTLKEHSIRRLEIVNELRGHLSVPSSSKGYM